MPEEKPTMKLMTKSFTARILSLLVAVFLTSAIA